MSRGKGNSKKKFRIVEASESVDQSGHLTPVPVGMTLQAPISSIGGVPVYESVDAPVGHWTAVPKGMTAVAGCYVDGAGVMRFKENNAPAVWHHPSGCKYHQPPCKRRITDPRDIMYHNGAPWCPDCFKWSAEDEEHKKREILNAPSSPGRLVSRLFTDKNGVKHEASGYVPEGTSEEIAQRILRQAVGEFIDVTDEEFGSDLRARQPVEPAQVQRINAASHKAASEIFRGGVSKQKFYPSGQPRTY